MRNLFITIILTLSLVSTATGACLYAAQKDVILTSTDLREDYDIIGIVTYASGSTDINDVNEGLKKKATQMNADYVLFIRYLSHAGMIYGWGTAVKVKKQKL